MRARVEETASTQETVDERADGPTSSNSIPLAAVQMVAKLKRRAVSTASVAASAAAAVVSALSTDDDDSAERQQPSKPRRSLLPSRGELGFLLRQPLLLLIQPLQLLHPRALPPQAL